MSPTAGVTASDRLQKMLSVFSLPNSTVLLARQSVSTKLWIWAVPGLLILAGAGAMIGGTVCRLLLASRC